MRAFLKRHARGNLVAWLALFVALSGTSYAAVKLPAGSVGTKQLKANAVTSAKVKNGSLQASDFRRLPVGPAGPAGSAGPAGPAGPQGLRGERGASGATNVVKRTGATGEDAGEASSTASCEAGERPVGGGGKSDAGFLDQSVPVPEDTAAPTGWRVHAVGDPADTVDATAYVICASP